MSDVEFLALPGDSQRAWLGYFKLVDEDEREAAERERGPLKGGR